jgi:hypothetical protein
MALVRAEISDELLASIIRVERINEIGTTLTITGDIHSVVRLVVSANVPSSLFLVTLMR